MNFYLFKFTIITTEHHFAWWHFVRANWRGS